MTDIALERNRRLGKWKILKIQKNVIQRSQEKMTNIGNWFFDNHKLILLNDLYYQEKENYKTNFPSITHFVKYFF